MVNILPIALGEETALVNQKAVPSNVRLRQKGPQFEIANPEEVPEFVAECHLQITKQVPRGVLSMEPDAPGPMTHESAV